MIVSNRPSAARALRLTSVAIATLAAVACGTKDAADPLQPSGAVGRVRFVNLITDPARNPVNAIFEGLPFGVNLTYTTSTPASLPCAVHGVLLVHAGGSAEIVLKKTADTTVTVATLSVNITANNDYTVFATGVLVDRRVVVHHGRCEHADPRPVRRAFA